MKYWLKNAIKIRTNNLATLASHGISTYKNKSYFSYSSSCRWCSRPFIERCSTPYWARCTSDITLFTSSPHPGHTYSIPHLVIGIFSEYYVKVNFRVAFNIIICPKRPVNEAVSTWEICPPTCGFTVFILWMKMNSISNHGR